MSTGAKHQINPRRAALAAVALVLAMAIIVTSFGPEGVRSDRGVQASDTTSIGDQAAIGTLGTTTRYAPISPLRVLDTRTDPVRRRLAANGSLSINPVTPAVSNASGVPTSQVRAVVLNITMVDSGSAGYATLWPTGSRQPTVSSLNTDFALQNVANLVTIPVGADGFVSLFTSTSADFTIDVQGVYAAASGATAGRLIPLEQRRAIDTRRGGTLGAGGSITVDLVAVGVPVAASAAVLNVTVANTAAAGFFTVWPAGAPMPLASNLNVPGPGYTVANQVIARTNAGRVTVFSEAGGDIIVDVSGYVTGASSSTGTAGLYVPLAPSRLLDTRSAGAYSTGRPMVSGTSVTLPIAGREGVPGTGVQGVALNVTATRTHGPGYVTGWPANTAMPATSSLNFVAADRTVPNHVITALGAGAVDFYSFGGNDLLVDLMGYWTDGSGPPTGAGGMPVTVSTVAQPVTTTPSPAPTTNGAYAFLYQDAPKSTVRPYGRWSPCAPIRYVANIDRASQPMIDQLNAAIAEVEQATGLDFVYIGPTSGGLDFAPPSDGDAIVGFSDQLATPHLAGGVIGVGGGLYDPTSGRVTSGFAFADVDGIASMEKLRATLMHEIAHMVGLDHVTDPGQLMYGSVTPNSTFAGGDRRGLWYVGAAQSCLAGDTAFDNAPGVAGAEPVLVVQT